MTRRCAEMTRRCAEMTRRCAEMTRRCAEMTRRCAEMTQVTSSHTTNAPRRRRSFSYSLAPRATRLPRASAIASLSRVRTTKKGATCLIWELPRIAAAGTCHIWKLPYMATAACAAFLLYGDPHRCAAPRMNLTVRDGVGLYGYVDESATADDIAEWEVHENM